MLWWCERVVTRDVWAGDAAFLTLGRDVKSVDGNYKIFNQNRNILWIRNKIFLSLLETVGALLEKNSEESWVNTWCQINVRSNKCIYPTSLRILTTSCCQVQCIWSAWSVQPGVQWPCLDTISCVWTRGGSCFRYPDGSVVCVPCVPCGCCRRGFPPELPAPGQFSKPAMAAPFPGPRLYTGRTHQGVGSAEWK